VIWIHDELILATTIPLHVTSVPRPILELWFNFAAALADRAFLLGFPDAGTPSGKHALGNSIRIISDAWL
jgi:hypothetical protein